ncbi:hypothetical protein KC571_00370 [candidate division WWE3 bacterium]|uniref:Uncharacterized protein n=1 Tax=candidate division WWE3 bacterium TaxID=2053526 RepID=A0A955LFQ4_UNCKA|nr:hypothetical protein [candidate division WWE3 bacterium]
MLQITIRVHKKPESFFAPTQLSDLGFEPDYEFVLPRCTSVQWMAEKITGFIAGQKQSPDEEVLLLLVNMTPQEHQFFAELEKSGINIIVIDLDQKETV